MGNKWTWLCGLYLTILAATTIRAIDPKITIESPEAGATFPEFSSPVLKVRVENGDGTLRYFAENPVSDYVDLLLYTNVGANAVHEVPLTNLPPGSYTIPVVTRFGDGGEGYVTNTISFAVTNRVRAVPKFAVTVLPGTNTTAARINNDGQIVGVSDGKAFRYDGEMHFLGTLGGVYSEAISINNKGQIVGISEDSSGVPRAFLWDAQNGMQQLLVSGTPSDINDSGDVIGNGEEGSFLYRNGISSTIPGPALDLNNDGYVALGDFGIYDTRSESRARWNEFLRLYQPVWGEDLSHVGSVAINDAHEITGYDTSTVGGGRYYCRYLFRYHAYRRERVSPYGTIASPQSINSLGDVVGWSTDVTYGPRGTTASETLPYAFIASRQGYSKLNNLIPDRGDLDVFKAFSINDRREVVGRAKTNGEQRAVLLRPLPEFQSVEFDAVSSKIKANVEGYISMRVKVETSANLKDWTLHTAQELTDAPLEIAMPIDGSSTYFRITRD